MRRYGALFVVIYFMFFYLIQGCSGDENAGSCPQLPDYSKLNPGTIVTTVDGQTREYNDVTAYYNSTTGELVIATKDTGLEIDLVFDSSCESFYDSLRNGNVPLKALIADRSSCSNLAKSMDQSMCSGFLYSDEKYGGQLVVEKKESGGVIAGWFSFKVACKRLNQYTGAVKDFSCGVFKLKIE